MINTLSVFQLEQLRIQVTDPEGAAHWLQKGMTPSRALTSPPWLKYMFLTDFGDLAEHAMHRIPRLRFICMGFEHAEGYWVVQGDEDGGDASKHLVELSRDAGKHRLLSNPLFLDGGLQVHSRAIIRYIQQQDPSLTTIPPTP